MAQNGGFQGFGYRVVRLPRWAAFLIVAASVLVGLLLMVLAAGLALIVVPVVLVAGVIAAWFGRGRTAGSGHGAGRNHDGHYRAGRNGSDYRGTDHRGTSGGDIVEGEYVVLDRDRTDDADGRG